MGKKPDKMMYTGSVPWHRIGVHVDAPQTSREAMILGGCDFAVEMHEVFHATPSGMVAIPNRKAPVRMDTWEVLGNAVHSDQYRPNQPSQSFKLFDAVIAQGQAIYETVGTLDGGARLWILAKLPDSLKIGSEILDKYILLTDSFDGSTALMMKPTTVRVVCHNTLQIALNTDTNRMFRHIHKGNLMDRAVEAREILGLEDAYFQMMLRGIDAMANTKVTEEEIEPMLLKIFTPDQVIAEGGAIGPVYRNQMDRVTDLFRGDEDSIAIYGDNRWDMMNAVTQFTDWEKGYQTLKNETEAQAKRIKSAWLGEGSALKQRAWDVLVPEGAI